MERQDVTWLDWERKSPGLEMDIFDPPQRETIGNSTTINLDGEIKINLSNRGLLRPGRTQPPHKRTRGDHWQEEEVKDQDEAAPEEAGFRRRQPGGGTGGGTGGGQGPGGGTRRQKSRTSRRSRTNRRSSPEED